MPPSRETRPGLRFMIVSVLFGMGAGLLGMIWTALPVFPVIVLSVFGFSLGWVLTVFEMREKRGRIHFPEDE